MAQGKPWVILTQDPDGAAGWLPALAAKGLAVRQWPSFVVDSRVPEVLCEHFPPLCPPSVCASPAGSSSVDEQARGSSQVGERLKPLPAEAARCLPSSNAGPSVTCPSVDEAAFQVYVLTSPAAVRVLAHWLRQRRRAWPAGVRVGVPGRGTASVFREQLGEQVPMILPEPPWQDGEHLAEAILHQLKGLVEAQRATSQAHDGQAHPTGKTAQVRVFNRPDGRTHWLQMLQQHGIQTSVMPIYAVQSVVLPPPGFVDWMTAHLRAADRLHWLLGATAPIHTVSGWLSGLPAAAADWARRQPVWVPHHRLVAVARATGFVRIQVYQDRQQLIEQLQ